MTPGHAPAVLAVVCWAVGLVQYLLTAALVLARCWCGQCSRKAS
ncbi:hypothetical protein [Streptomyces sp900105755]|uniref:Uncharacterized protein n=1 Tax=Streptomyces sp. 900105755 TaxID=3154389 RepID=A0ABV1TUB2_9ACTN